MKVKLPKKIKASKKLKKYLAIFLVILIVGLVLFKIKDWFVVAVVNNRPITRLSLIRKIEQQAGAQALDNLIQQNLITQAAKKAKVNIGQKEIDDEITKLTESLKKEGVDLETFLQYQGLSQETLAEQIKIQLTVKQILSQDIQITDKEINDYFASNSATFTKGAKLADVKPQIVDTLTQSKLSEAFTTWMENLRKEAKILYFKTY